MVRDCPHRQNAAGLVTCGNQRKRGPFFLWNATEGANRRKSCNCAFFPAEYDLSFQDRAHQTMESQKPPISADSVGTVSRLFSDAREGDPRAAAELFPLVYAELRNLARQR